MTGPLRSPFPGWEQLPWRPRRSLRRQLLITNIVALLLVLFMGVIVFVLVMLVRRHVENVLGAVPPIRLALQARPRIDALLGDVYRYGDPDGMTPERRNRLILVLSIHRTQLQETTDAMEAWLYAQPGEQPLIRPMAEILYLLREADEAAGILIQAVQNDRWDDVASVVRQLELLATRLEVNANVVLRIADTQWRQALGRILRDLVYIVWAPGIVAMLVIGLILAQAYGVQRWVLRPLLNAIQGLEAFARGQMDFRFAETREDEIGLMARVFNRMAEQIQQSRLYLEQQVQERTRALQRRMAQTVAAAEIGRLISMERNVETLLRRAVSLIAERFGFYVVNVFLLDESGQWAVLRASSHPGGERLIQRGFRLRVGEQGIVGYVAQTNRERVVGDVTEDPFYYANPEFPDTRSEAAFPLRVGETVRGVLDIQSTLPHAFKAEDLETLHIVTDLLAVALENAELLARREEALRALQRAQNLLTEAAWQQFLRTYVAPGYRYRKQMLEAVMTPMEHAPSSEDGRRIRVPVTLYGLPMATLELEKPEGQRWSQAERDLLQGLAERLAVALENARHFVLSQRRLGWLHRIVEMAHLPVLRPMAEVADQVVMFLHREIGWPHVVIYRWDAEAQRAEPVAGEARWSSPLRAEEWAASGILDQVLQREQPYLEVRFRWPGGRLGTWLLLPLRVGEVVWGMLEIGEGRPFAFTQDDLPILRLLSEQVASALENARLFEVVQDLLRSHERIHAMVTQLAAAESPEAAMHQVVEELARLYPDTAIALYRWDEAIKALTLHHAYPRDASVMRVVTGSNTPYLQALTQGRSVWLNITAEHRAFFGSGYRSLMIVPLRYGETRLGVLVFQRPRVDGFDQQDVEILGTLGQVLSAVFHNLHLVERLNRHTRELNILYTFAEALARHTEQQPLLNEAAQRFLEPFDAMHCGIALFEYPEDGIEPEFSVLVASASRPGAPGAEMLGVRFPHAGDWAIQTIKQTLRPVILPRVQEDTRLTPTIRELLRERGTQTLVILPLVVRGRIIGTVGLDFAEPERTFTEDEQRLMEQMAAQFSSALERVQLLETLRRRAEREHTVREITARLRAGTHPRDVLQTFLQELRRVLQASRIQVLIRQELPGSETLLESGHDDEAHHHV